MKATQRPSRYHIEPSAKSSRPRPKKPPKSGTRLTDFSTLSSVVLSPIQSLPDALAEPRTGTMPGSETPVSEAMRRTEPPLASAGGRRTSSVEMVSANSGALTGPTWASAERSPLPTW